MSASAQHSSGQKSSPRVLRACDRCRYRKVRCDGNSPCSGCRPGGHDCVFRPPRQTRQRRQHTRHFAEGPQAGFQREPSTYQQLQLPESSLIAPLRSTAHVLQDPVQFKRQMELRAGIGVTNVETGSFQFYGPSSHFCFIERMCQRIDRTTNETMLTPRASTTGSLGKWNLERFMFLMDGNHPASTNPEAYISREIGTSLIRSFFEIMHPQVPVLNHVDIFEQWEDMGKPPRQQGVSKCKEILFMVLAIGARVAIAEGQHDTSVLQDWAEHFSSKANGLHTTFEDLSLSSTHFLLLKAMYAYQVMRPNEAWLYLGHAARSAMALGINRQQVVNGTNTTVHSLKRTFWIIYAHERWTSLYTGRPSTFRDDLVDAPYPEDFPVANTSDNDTKTEFSDSLMLCGFVRAMADIGRVADRVFLEIYSPKNISSISHPMQGRDITTEVEMLLESAIRKLPLNLHFFDTSLPLGHGWQEIQRLILGCHYYLVRMLMHRPALLFAALFDSKEEAQRNAEGSFDIGMSIQETTKAASKMIDLVHDVYFRRYPRARFDGSSASLLVSACTTLLYDVLDPKTNADHAKDAFIAVERGVECLDQIHHLGQTTGKSLSLDVMQIAKNTLRSSTVDPELSQNLFGEFPWLQYPNPSGSGPLVSAHPDTLTVPSTIHQELAPPLATDLQESSHVSTPEASYMAHWLEAGFAPEEIPSCLF
ncbi:unnamed protein product [Penicillium salamii]|uniref:Zn(2)-C6 fungal-type domain-containing protein n=1 Tax=Penicillium salamii TaxID=1612424 RepID=A0A9W4JRQ2_9EURO|nr:unnamed protein product [Penicillium salamii]CAG8189643.1 unnamed protein product [Penicillium salamii]CAG8248484.1 unnamed protein product [Penicillium salamii]CAG8252325.1 unnamed protein product [Penicillium salamii]CAG8275554.1 unnamed protein product [Penicillium salamii]